MPDEPVPTRAGGVPPADVGSALADLVLLDDEGKPARLGDAWKERPAVVALLRHWG